jgi:hypothetical protein
VIRVQGSPGNHYLHVVPRRPRPERRPLRASLLDIGSAVIVEPDEAGSVARAFLIGLPISLALWAPVVWAMSRIL